ncbi:hypothetical protein GCM10009085_48510 [Pseudomonas avellanae]|nr:hypothetical protein GCM10009085_48510 [Pseudomonas avellanae]
MGKAGLQRLSNIRVRRLTEHIQFYLRAFDDTTGLKAALATSWTNSLLGKLLYESDK